MNNWEYSLCQINCSWTSYPFLGNMSLKDWRLAWWCVFLEPFVSEMDPPYSAGSNVILFNKFHSRIPSILTCFEKKQSYHNFTWQINLDMVARLCAIINSSVNFIIYCYAGKQFRTCLLQMFKKAQYLSSIARQLSLSQIHMHGKQVSSGTVNSVIIEENSESKDQKISFKSNKTLTQVKTRIVIGEIKKV